MKKILLILFSLLTNTIANAQCSTTFVTTQDCRYDPLNTFSMNSIASVGNGNTFDACNSNGYYSFATPVRTLTIGSTITWTATVGHNMYQDGIGIWIDLNNNNIFEDTEYVSSSAPALSHSQSFVMPSGVTGTPLKMRIRNAYQYMPTATQACTNGIGTGYGETEDYFVILSPSLDAASFNSLDFKIFPNPTKGIVTINHANVISEIEVINVLGKSILKQSCNTNEVQLDLTSFANETYFIKVTSDNQSKTIKLIKE